MICGPAALHTNTPTYRTSANNGRIDWSNKKKMIEKTSICDAIVSLCDVCDVMVSRTDVLCQIYRDSAQNWFRLAPNGTNLGLFKINFLYILDQQSRELDWFRSELD